MTSRARENGWTGAEWKCLDELIWRESSWRLDADNPNSSAYGLFQMLKMKPGTDRDTQVRIGFRYIQTRYGTPCKAIEHHNRKGWY